MIMVEQFDPETHHRVETSQIRYLREVTVEPNLFMLHHDDTDTFSICVWVQRHRGQFQTLLLLRSLSSLSRENVDSLLKWAKGKSVTQEEAIREHLRLKRKHRRKMDEEEEEARDAMKFLGRRFQRRWGAHAGTHPAYNRSSFAVQMG